MMMVMKKMVMVLVITMKKRPEAERGFLFIPGGDEDGLLWPHVRDLAGHPGPSYYHKI